MSCLASPLELSLARALDPLPLPFERDVPRGWSVPLAEAPGVIAPSVCTVWPCDSRDGRGSFGSLCPPRVRARARKGGFAVGSSKRSRDASRALTRVSALLLPLLYVQGLSTACLSPERALCTCISPLGFRSRTYGERSLRETPR
jgi:hypothetical protein